VAHALIKGGVRCVIAAGWAVDDNTASVFAKAFYTALLGGVRFIDAVAAARESAYARGGNTWAAYQCYGDPDWQFRPATGDAQSPTRSLGQEFAGIASAQSLLLALEQVAVQGEYQGKPADVQAARLRYLEATFGQYLDRGDVAEAFGNAWSKSGRFPESITWYERARRAQDGRASLVAVEQLANARIRQAWDNIKDLKNDPAPSATAIGQARDTIKEAMDLLDTLLALAPTYERESIYGSGFKRLALVEVKAGRAAEEKAAIAQMWQHYRAAEMIARKMQTHSFFYPAMNRIAAQLALSGGATSLDKDEITAVRESMSSASPDFWSVVGQTELDVFVSMAAGRLSRDVDNLIEDFRKHHARVHNPRMWASVVDNARFVSCRYRRCPESERIAADRLLSELESLAGGMAPATSSGIRRTPRLRPKGGKHTAKAKRHR
jgi:tetratricopeptide (TPR) repeat protein